MTLRHTYARAWLWLEDRGWRLALAAVAAALLTGLALALGGCDTVVFARESQDGGFHTATELFALCTSSDSMERMTCYGYIQGSTDAIMVTVDAAGGTCEDGYGRTTEQLRLMFLKTFFDDLEHAHYSAARALMRISGCSFPRTKPGVYIPPGKY